ncbi:hypothetical protein DL93DRAFT_2221252 [Clavulina sp. PMI_390]|nr:hypothetical protein DL93DRAFT_2221252 [Clavulina sp. PMI_390]
MKNIDLSTVESRMDEGALSSVQSSLATLSVEESADSHVAILNFRSILCSHLVLTQRFPNELASSTSFVELSAPETIERATQLVTLIEKIASALEGPGDPNRKQHAPLFRAEAVRVQRALSKDTPLHEQSSLARLLLAQADALYSLHRLTEALMLHKEALEIHREAYRVSPGAGRPLFTAALHSYSTRLHSKRPCKEALEMMEEAVKLWRLLYELDGSVYLHPLANSLCMFADQLSAAQRFRDAKSAQEECLPLCRLLVAEDPDEHLWVLKGALDQYIDTLRDLGLPNEYRAARNQRKKISGTTSEAVHHTPPTPFDSPSHQAPCLYQCTDPTEQDESEILPQILRQPYGGPSPELVAVLNNLENDDTIQDGKVKEYIKHAQELIPQILIGDSLPRDLCSRAITFRDLLQHIDSFIYRSPEEKRKKYTLVLRKEAVHIQRTLSSGTPLSHQENLSLLLRNLALELANHGQFSEACLIDEEALVISRECYRVHPGAHRPHLAALFHTYANQLACQERFTEALPVWEEAIALRRVLYKLEPDMYMAALVKSLQGLIEICFYQRRFKDARILQEEEVLLQRTLYHKEPSQYYDAFFNSLNYYVATLEALHLTRDAKAARAERDKLWRLKK